MEDKDIKTLRKLLEFESRKDLSSLLENCKSGVDTSSQYGSYPFSILSRFLIYAPVGKYKQLKNLADEDEGLLLKLILDIYPHQSYSPEITSVDFRVLQEGGNNEPPEPERPYVGRTIRIFLSYSTEDKVMAGKIKVLLESYGFEIFLAHEDIKPSEEWQKVILQNLDSTDIFIPVITLAFQNSPWTDQESGYALAKGKKIIPLALNDFLPYGFLGPIQAAKCNLEDINKDLSLSVNRIVDEIKKDPKFKDSYIDSLVRRFTNSYSFNAAKELSRELLEVESLTEEQVNAVVKASLENLQIKCSWGAQDNLEKMVKKFKGSISKDLLSKFNKEYHQR